MPKSMKDFEDSIFCKGHSFLIFTTFPHLHHSSPSGSVMFNKGFTSTQPILEGCFLLSHVICQLSNPDFWKGFFLVFFFLLIGAVLGVSTRLTVVQGNERALLWELSLVVQTVCRWWQFQVEPGRYALLSAGTWRSLGSYFSPRNLYGGGFGNHHIHPGI